nr:unnamed protein product [Spirometra erinaceieuropaei]
MAAGVPVCSRWAHRMGAARQQLLRISLTEEPYALKMPDSLSQVPPPLDPAPADSVPWSSVFPDPFWRLRGRGSPPDPVLIDARSPSEFAEDHLPGAINIPVLSDEQRAEVGKMYCSGDVLGARLRGASYVCANISRSLSESTPSAPSLTSLFGSTGPSGSKVKPPFLLVYCWRGGQRQMHSPSITTVADGSNRSLYLDFADAAKTLRPNLKKQLSELGLTDGQMLNVSDVTTPRALSFRLCLSKSGAAC